MKLLNQRFSLQKHFDIRIDLLIEFLQLCQFPLCHDVPANQEGPGDGYFATRQDAANENKLRYSQCIFLMQYLEWPPEKKKTRPFASSVSSSLHASTFEIHVEFAAFLKARLAANKQDLV